MTAKIKLNAASGGGSFSIQAPSSSSNNRVFTLPDIPDTSLSTVNGITQADQWRITSNFSTNDSYITSNWERNDTSFQLIGSGLTESSGVFSFPTTGIYFILGTTRGYASAARSYTGIQIDATQNNSSYSNIADGFSATSAENYFDATFAVIFDVPDVSTHKFKIYVNAQATVEYGGSSTGQQTGITVIKLGDT